MLRQMSPIIQRHFTNYTTHTSTLFKAVLMAITKIQCTKASWQLLPIQVQKLSFLLFRKGHLATSDTCITVQLFPLRTVVTLLLIPLYLHSILFTIVLELSVRHYPFKTVVLNINL